MKKARYKKVGGLLIDPYAAQYIEHEMVGDNESDKVRLLINEAVSIRKHVEKITDREELKQIQMKIKGVDVK